MRLNTDIFVLISTIWLSSILAEKDQKKESLKDVKLPPCASCRQLTDSFKKVLLGRNLENLEWVVKGKTTDQHISVLSLN